MNKAKNNTAPPDYSTEFSSGRIADEIDAAGDFLDAIYMAAQALNGEEVTAIQRLAATALRHIEEAQKEIGLYTARAAR